MQFKHYSLKDKDFWIDDLREVINGILKSSDQKRENYNEKNFVIDDQLEMSVIYLDNKLVTFSTVWTRDCYPDQTYRILNRSWKDPSIRWGKPAYFILSKLMVDHQLNYCKEVGAKFAFVSSQGKRKLWLKKWVAGANADNHNFKQLDGMVKVCNGDAFSCWQNVAYIPLTESSEIPAFEIMSYEDWDKHDKAF